MDNPAPGKCTRCARPATVLYTSVLCTNTACASYDRKTAQAYAVWAFENKDAPADLPALADETTQKWYPRWWRTDD